MKEKSHSFYREFQFSRDEDINNIFFKASVFICLRSFSIATGKGPKSERNVLIYFFRLESLDIPPVVADLWLTYYAEQRKAILIV